MGKGELSSSKVAERLGVAHSTVRAWCNRGLFPNARLEETIVGSFWVIPESDLKDFQPPERGRPPNKAGKKKC
jgi:predicted site-specific integrase-resolvase